MRILRKLLDNLGDVWNKLPKDVPFITISKGTGTHTMVSVDEGMLHFHSVPFRSELPQKQSIVLKGMTSPELIATITSMGYGAVFASEALSLGINDNAPIILIEVSNVVLGATLSAFTSNLWRTMYPIYRVLRQAEFDTAQAMKQLQRPLSDGDWLDFWASFFSISRDVGETDNNFVRRFTMWLFNPKTNNIALKELLSYRLQDTNIDVHDKAPMQFELLVGTKYLADATALHDILKEAKGAGIQYFLNYVAPTYSEDYPLWVSDQTGKPFSSLDVPTVKPTKTATDDVPQAFEFSGNGSLSTGSNLATSAAQKRTTEAWVYGDVTGSIVMHGAAASAQMWVLNITASGTPQLDRGGGSAGGSGALARNAWNHVVATYDGTTITVYLNGVYHSQALATLITPSSVMKIGDGYYGKMTGRVQSVRWYNRDLSASEVLANYTGTATRTGLVGEWLFSSGTLNDTAGTNNLTLTGSGMFARYGDIPTETVASQASEVMYYPQTTVVDFAGKAQTGVIMNVGGRGQSGTMNFVGKELGSKLVNPHLAYRGAATSLMTPSTYATLGFSEMSNGYVNLVALDGKIQGSDGNLSALNMIGQTMFSFDVIAYIERTNNVSIGVDLPTKVAWLKANVSSITARWYGYGTCPAGFKASLAALSGGAWYTLNSHTLGAVTGITPTIVAGVDADLPKCIQADGTINLLAYTDASNGVVGSNLVTDYVELYIEYRAPFINANTLRWVSATNSTGLTSPTGGTWSEESVQNYLNVSTINSVYMVTSRSGAGQMAQHLFSFDLVSYIERKHGVSIGVDLPSKVAWLKANMANVTCNWWGFGSSGAVFKAYIKVWATDTSSWYGTISNTSSSSTKLVATYSTATTIDANGFTYFIMHTDPSDGVSTATLTTEYAELQVDYVAPFLNPHIAKHLGTSNTGVLQVPTSGLWNSFSAGATSLIASLDGTSQNNATVNSTAVAQILFSFDLITLMEKKYGRSIGVDVPTKVAWLKANITSIVVSWTGFGSSKTGFKATFTWWIPSTSGASPNNQWRPQINAFTHTSGTPAALNVLNNQTQTNYHGNPANTIETDGFVHFLAYAEPALALDNPTVAPTLSTSVNTSKNMLPNLYGWTINANAVINSAYSLTLNATGGFQHTYVYIPVVSGLTYTLSSGALASANHRIYVLKDKQIVTQFGTISNTPSTFTFTADSSFNGFVTVSMTSAVAGTFTFTNPQLEQASSASAFQPQPLAAGTYYVKYCWVIGGVGKSLASPEQSITITAGQNIVVTSPALPFGTGYIDVYMSTSSNTETYQGGTSTGLTTYTHTKQLVSGLALPTQNTAIVASSINTDYINLTIVDIGNGVTEVSSPAINVTTLSELITPASEVRDIGLLQASPSEPFYFPPIVQTTPTFTRASTAYLPDGTLVASGQPRMVPAANGKFGAGVYLEEATTNLATITGDVYQNVSYDGVVSIANPHNSANVRKYTITGTSSIPRARFIMNVTVGQTYTVSLVMKMTGVSAVYYISAYKPNPEGANVIVLSGETNSSTDLGGGWFRYVYTFTVVSNTTSQCMVTYGVLSGAVAGDSFYVYNEQFENKPYATSYVPASRAIDLLTMPNSVLTDAGGWTIECWAKLDTTSGGVYRMIFSSWGKFFVAMLGNQPTLSYTNGVQVTKFATALANPTAWHNWSMTFDGATVVLYVDGVAVITEVTNLPSNLAGSSPLGIGCMGTGGQYPVNGIISDFRISNIARSASEVLLSAQATAPSPVDRFTVYKLPLYQSLAPTDNETSTATLTVTGLNDTYVLPVSPVAVALETTTDTTNDPVTGSGELFDHSYSQDQVTMTLTVGGSVISTRTI